MFPAAAMALQQKARVERKGRLVACATWQNRCSGGGGGQRTQADTARPRRAPLQQGSAPEAADVGAGCQKRRELGWVLERAGRRCCRLLSCGTFWRAAQASRNRQTGRRGRPAGRLCRRSARAAAPRLPALAVSLIVQGEQGDEMQAQWAHAGLSSALQAEMWRGHCALARAAALPPAERPLQVRQWFSHLPQSGFSVLQPQENTEAWRPSPRRAACLPARARGRQPPPRPARAAPRPGV